MPVRDFALEREVPGREAVRFEPEPTVATLATGGDGPEQWLVAGRDVGPLSGKTLMAVIIWLLSWAGLHAVLRSKPYETHRAVTIALVLIGIGVLGTFPTFFQLFTAE